MGKPRRSRTATYVLIALALPTLALAKTWTFSWDSRPVEIQRDADGFAKISIDGGVELGDPGAPDLPWVHMSIDLDPGTVVTSWRFIPDAPRTIDQSLRPVPLQRALSSADTDRSPTEAAESAYAVDQPSSAAIFQGMRSSRGKMSAGFLFAPFRWEAASGRLDFVSGGTLEVETGPAPEGVFLPPPLREADLAPSEVAGRAPGAGRVLNAESGDLRVSALPSLEGMAVPSVIVTTEELKPAFQWLADWKTRDGRLTVIRTVEEIAAAYPQGVDEAEKIRLFLRDAYLYWGTKSVVMGGDPSIVPIRRARSYSWNAPEGLDITTDYYYACLDGNWNANGNALFGQAVRRYTNEIGDQTDFQPELVVGRISAKNAAEVAIYRQKYETYVQNPPAGSYYDDVLTMGEVLFDSNWRAGDCDECGAGCPSDTPCVNDDGAGDCFAMQQLLRDNPRVGGNWNFTELYERDYWWVTRGHPNAQPLNLSTVVSELNAGKNLVFHSGHGDRDRWAIGPDRMEARNLRALTNGPRYGGMVYSINCNSAAIAFDCAAEAWCFAPEGGGLLYVGSTNPRLPGVRPTVPQDRTFKLCPNGGHHSGAGVLRSGRFDRSSQRSQRQREHLSFRAVQPDLPGRSGHERLDDPAGNDGGVARARRPSRVAATNVTVSSTGDLWPTPGSRSTRQSRWSRERPTPPGSSPCRSCPPRRGRARSR
ncbi:MAG: C25 family cysteine peptidase [Candidatus Eisenbacteria bacterium]